MANAKTPWDNKRPINNLAFENHNVYEASPVKGKKYTCPVCGNDFIGHEGDPNDNYGIQYCKVDGQWVCSWTCFLSRQEHMSKGMTLEETKEWHKSIQKRIPKGTVTKAISETPKPKTELSDELKKDFGDYHETTVDISANEASDLFTDALNSLK